MGCVQSLRGTQRREQSRKDFCERYRLSEEEGDLEREIGNSSLDKAGCEGKVKLSSQGNSKCKVAKAHRGMNDRGSLEQRGQSSGYV